MLVGWLWKYSGGPAPLRTYVIGAVCCAVGLVFLIYAGLIIYARITQAT
jgi:hypothetical protein